MDDPLADELRALEEGIANRDPGIGPFESLIDGSFVEFGQSGRRWDRGAILDHLATPPGQPVTLEDVRVDRLADDVALVTYATAPARTRRSSLWVRRDDRWRLRFHQGTPIPDEEES